MMRRALTGTAILAALGLAGCSSTPSEAPARPLTPVETAMAWFHAINTDDVPTARGLFVPSQRQQIAWLNQPKSDLSTFTHLHCGSTSTSSERASVKCTFRESASPTEGNPDSFWSIYMQRAPGGHWLINGYGQP
jgi:hypothetical protein